MGDGALTKAQLDAVTAEWREELAAKGFRVEAPAPVVKPTTASSAAASTLQALQDIARALFDQQQQIDKLQQRLAELERSQKTYLGVWRDGREYTPQSEVTHDGGRRFCHKRTSDKPGESADWTLMEKSAPTSHSRSDTSTVDPRNGSSHTTSRSRTP